MPKRCWNLYSVAKAGAAPRGEEGAGVECWLKRGPKSWAKVGQAKNKINYVACSQWSC